MICWLVPSSMRRLAAVFKRDKKPLPVPSPSSSLSTPQLSIASDRAPSSVSSSDHSPSFNLPTPTDELPLSLSSKRSWRTWIGARRSSSLKHRPPAPAIPDWPPKQDSEEEEEEDQEDDYGHDPVPTPLASPIKAHHNLEIRLKNSLVPPLPVSPFVQHDLGPFFPRSSNRSRFLPPQSSIRVAMFRKHLLSRLHRPDPPSSAELSSIRPFGTTPPPSILSPPAPSFPDSAYPPKATKIFPASPGVRRWIARPCFEDRHQVYLAVQGRLDCGPVSATAAVAALEYSEYLDVVVDPDFGLFPSQPDVPPTLPQSLSHTPALETQPLTAAPKRNSYTAVPSPLRNHHTSPPTLQEPGQLSAPKSSVKRIVRFAEDNSDGDDGVPLHVVRMKKKREQKANFLRQERLKRAKEDEDERRQREQEATLREQEAVEKEQRRQAFEKERKEREKALYAETIATTRMRRETQRTGGVASSNTPSQSANLLGPSSSLTSLKDSERNKPSDPRRFSRMHHDPPSSISIPRREASDQSLYPNSPASYAHQQYPSDSSPGSSRPPSIAHSPVSLNSPGPGHHSRPPSTYSSSSEDARQQGGSIRNSVAAAGSGSLSAFSRPPMIASYPTWSGSNPNISYIPPVPPFPDYVHDMPLLPPTAPFMKHSYKPRSPSSRNVSPGPSTSSGSRRGSFNSSTERVNQAPNPPQITAARTPSSSPHPRRQSSASSSRPTHQRQGSGDSRNTSRTQHSTSAMTSPSRPVPTTSRSHPTLSRGRSLQPQSLVQAPSSWVPTSPVQPVFVPVPIGVPVGMQYSMGAMSPSASNAQMQMQMQMQGLGIGMPMMAMPMNFVGTGPVGVGSGNGGSMSSRTRGRKQPDIS
ncbi:hypothetical protein GALMADRAFT_661005 [Galerina marginata CBS 339.88]|uniref:Uncharacterized protein n=1 Tax=Galerina marginata (strain CBS 339.88) TaxID=685588 RepID=A0A067TXA4_GALM3|nr:hypothetical protein GALMADRAFT_661005 [Galerina marginata CBS 339.88]